MTQRRHIVKDIAVYVLISLLVVAGLIAAALSKLPEALIMKWFGSALFTTFVFGYFLEKGRSFWNRKLFWLLAGSFLFLHCGMIGVILHYGEDFGKIWWVFAIEMFILLQVTRIVFLRYSKRPANHHKLPTL